MTNLNKKQNVITHWNDIYSDFITDMACGYSIDIKGVVEVINDFVDEVIEAYGEDTDQNTEMFVAGIKYTSEAKLNGESLYGMIKLMNNLVDAYQNIKPNDDAANAVSFGYSE